MSRTSNHQGYEMGSLIRLTVALAQRAPVAASIGNEAIVARAGTLQA